MSVIGNI